MLILETKVEEANEILDYASGKDVFEKIYQALNKDNDIKVVAGSWSYGSNLKAFNENLRKMGVTKDIVPTNAQLIDAARNTFTGEMATRKNFNNIVVTPKTRDADGNYTEVYADFIK